MLCTILLNFTLDCYTLNLLKTPGRGKQYLSLPVAVKLCGQCQGAESQLTPDSVRHSRPKAVCVVCGILLAEHFMGNKGHG